MTRVRAYLGMSLDGRVAGPDDDLSWLEGRDQDAARAAVGEWAARETGAPLEFEAFLDGVGCILMGRRTYDIVVGFDGWPYGDIPMLVATHRPLEPARPTVTAAAGPIAALVDRAARIAGAGDVYVDGASMVRTALDAGALDHLIVTIVPTVIGRGVALFDGLERPAELSVERVARYGDGLVQLHLLCPARPRG